MTTSLHRPKGEKFAPDIVTIVPPSAPPNQGLIFVMIGGFDCVLEPASEDFRNKQSKTEKYLVSIISIVL